MAKATHNGTCQCCGRNQAVKKGVLAKHGYTVENGYFEGTCVGTSNKPLQNCRELLDNNVAEWDARIQRMSTQKKRLEDQAKPHPDQQIPCIEWVNDRYGLGGYVTTLLTFDKFVKYANANDRKNIGRNSSTMEARFQRHFDRWIFDIGKEIRWFEAHKTMMLDLADEVHGQPLIPRK